MGLLLHETNLDAVTRWFADRGATDHRYLKGHYNRFLRSFQIINAQIPSHSLILDVGAHWLHQAFFFADAGHRLICADLPATMNSKSVLDQAKAMHAETAVISRLELGGGLEHIADNSIDVILFCEILEHLAFNPIPMWKQFYRLLRPSGRIYISTPNSCYYRQLYKKLANLNSTGEYGVSVSQILGDGTFGHHWKEYSISEIVEYFRVISPDFLISQSQSITFDGEEEMNAVQHFVNNSKLPHIDFCGLIDDLERKGQKPFGSQLFIEIILQEKSHGIQINPPWIPE